MSCPFQSLSHENTFTSFRNLGCRLHASSWWPVDSIAHSHVNSLKLLTQAEAPIIYMYNAMASVLAYYHRLPMPLGYFVYLLVFGLCVICMCYWVFSRDFDMNWQPTMHFSLM